MRRNRALKAIKAAAVVAALVMSVGCSCDHGPTSPTAQSAACRRRRQGRPRGRPRPMASSSSWMAVSPAVSSRTRRSGPCRFGVSVYCDACGEVGHDRTFTDTSGVYRFSGGVWVVPGYTTYLIVGRLQGSPDCLPAPGYCRPGMERTDSNRRYAVDIELVRRGPPNYHRQSATQLPQRTHRPRWGRLHRPPRRRRLLCSCCTARSGALVLHPAQAEFHRLVRP